MVQLLVILSLATGLSESIQRRLPEDPEMIYTASFPYQGIKVGIDWRNHQVVPERVCRKSAPEAKPRCRQAAASWLKDECAYYDAKRKLSKKQKKARREGAPQPAATAAPCGGPTDALLGALALGPGGVTRGSDAGTNKRKARDADKGAGRRGGVPATLAALEAGLASGPKAGKRSHAFPRSGNRTARFK